MTTPAVAAGSGRRVGWLELFFDLVFVVVIQRLTDLLHDDPGALDFAAVAVLAVFVWACWINVTLLTNVAGGVGARSRPLVFLSMAGVALIAVAIPGVTDDTGWLFAVGYAVARTAVWPLWVRSRDVVARTWWGPTVFGPGLGALWVASIAVPEPARWAVWAALVAVEIAFLVRGLPTAPHDAMHMIERVGLFVMIVLGESVVVLILAVDTRRLAVELPVALLAFAVICCFWWIYFDLGTRAEGVFERDETGRVFRDVLVFDHFFYVVALVGVAAGLGAAIEHAGEPRLPHGSVVAVAGGAAVFYLAQVATAVRYGERVRFAVVWASPSLALSALLLVLGPAFAPWAVVAVVLAGALVHVVSGDFFWRRRGRYLMSGR